MRARLRDIRSKLERLSPAVANRLEIAIQIARRRPIIVARLCDGLQIKLRNSNKGDLFVFKEVFIDEVYRSATTTDFGEGSVIDIGAHIGSFALWISKFASSIICVEPDPCNAQLLRDNIFSNGLCNRVSVVEAGVCSVDGKGELNVNPANSVLHSMRQRGALANHASVEIRTLSLKTLLDSESIFESPLAKIDCEGSEFDTILCADALTLRRLKSLVIEVHDHDNPDFTPDALQSHLIKSGFSVDWSPRRDLPKAGRGLGIGILKAVRQ